MKTHGMTGKRNAVKENPLDAYIGFRLGKERKESYEKSANNESLTSWILRTLDKEVNN